MTTQFTLTEQHIKLLRNANVSWNRAEHGSPQIDPKRPYGNSFSIGDMAEILGVPVNDAGYPSEADCRRLRAIHRETELALEIILVTGQFTPGTYVRTEAWLTDWKPASQEAA